MVVKALACELPSCRPEAPAALVESEGEELCLRLPGLVHAALPGRDPGSPPDAHGGRGSRCGCTERGLPAGQQGASTVEGAGDRPCFRARRRAREASVHRPRPAGRTSSCRRRTRRPGRAVEDGGELGEDVGMRASETRTFHSSPATRSRCCRTDPVRPVGAVVGRLGGVGDRGGGDGAVDGDLDVERRGRARPRVRPLHVTTPAANRPGASAATNEVPAGSCPSPPTPVAVHGSRCEG